MSIWIASHINLRRHPKTVRLCQTLSAKDVHMVGHLTCLWHWVAEYACDGVLEKFTTKQISDAAGWDSDPEKFVKSLIDCGFIDYKRGKKCIHDWMDFCGDPIKKRIYRQQNRPPSSAVVRLRPPKSAYKIGEDRIVEDNKTSTKRVRVFCKPSALEVSTYAKTIGFELDGQKFCDHYESNGWKVGRNPMRSWEAAVRTWKNRNPGGTIGAYDSKGVYSVSFTKTGTGSLGKTPAELRAIVDAAKLEPYIPRVRNNAVVETHRGEESAMENGHPKPK